MGHRVDVVGIIIPIAPQVGQSGQTSLEVISVRVSESNLGDPGSLGGAQAVEAVVGVSQNFGGPINVVFDVQDIAPSVIDIGQILGRTSGQVISIKRNRRIWKSALHCYLDLDRHPRRYGTTWKNRWRIIKLLTDSLSSIGV
jgi:hypothetical protein